jgi:hypothetical protein
MPDRRFVPLAGLVEATMTGEVAPARHAEGRVRLVAALDRERARRDSGLFARLAGARAGFALAFAAAAALVLWMGFSRGEFGARWMAWRSGAMPAEASLAVPAPTPSAEHAVAPMVEIELPDDDAPLRTGAPIPVDGAGEVELARGAVARLARPNAAARKPGAGAATAGRARQARLALETGEARVTVGAHATLGFLIDAGPFAVAVESGSARVAWSRDQHELAVDVDSGVTRVSAAGGDPLRVMPHEPLRVRADGRDLRDARERNGAPRASTAGSARETTPVARGAWPERVARGDFASVVDEANGLGLDAVLRERGPADLAALGDAARFLGRSDTARAAFLAVRNRFGTSDEARLAAYLLGRMADDVDGAAASAVMWYDRYLREAPGGALRGEALGRRMVAIERSAGGRAAADAARDYLRVLPEGPYAARARSLVDNGGR